MLEPEGEANVKRLLLIRKIKAVISIILLIFLLIFIGERIYNSKDIFQTTAKDASYYGIIEAKFTNKEKLNDFNYLYNLLEENYPFFKVNQRLHHTDWLGNKSKYERIIKNAEYDSEFLVAMNNILSELNDENTYILTGDIYNRYYKHYYPERLEILHYEKSLIRYNFDGSLKIDPNNNFIFHNGPVLNTKVLIDNEVAYMKIKAMSYYHMDEDYNKIKSFLKQVENYDKLIIDIRGNKGGDDDYWKNIVGLLIDDVSTAQYYSFFKQTSKSTNDPFKVPNITTIKNIDEKVLEQLPEEIMTDFNFYKTNLVEINPKGDINFKGKVYLLVDEEVVSASEKFAAFAKDTGFATLVGDKTGGGMAFADIPIANVPVGGYIISYSRELVLNSDYTINMETKTIPHILVDDTIPNDDLTKDKCIQAVINDEK